MNHNMRKMYTEQEIAELIAKYGGTKLYKHYIEFEVSGTSKEIIVISLYNEPYTFADLYGSLGDGTYISIIYAETGSSLIYSGSESSLYLMDSGALDLFYDFAISPDEDTFTDTVTPL